MGLNCCKIVPGRKTRLFNDSKSESELHPTTPGPKNFDDLSVCDTISNDQEDRADGLSTDSDLGSECLSIAYSSITDDDDNLALSSSGLPDIPEERPYVCSRLGSIKSQSSDRSVSMLSNQSIGDTIQWKKGNRLGRGSFGTVWCGLTITGELIAVKQIELNMNDLDEAEKEYEKIVHEVELLRSLKHQHIVGYLGTSMNGNEISIFMQYVPGGSLSNILLRFGPLEEAVVCRYTKQILEGVEYLHKNNVIHRDIKSGNIMLMPDGILKLIDFGCAKRITQSSAQLQMSIRGTPYWMAPEAIKHNTYGRKSDIWSIGCSVFELAQGKPPWGDMDPLAAMFAIGSDNKPIPELSEKFSLTCRNFVKACLHRNPNLRPMATAMLRHPFISSRKVSSIRRRRPVQAEDSIQSKNVMTPRTKGTAI